MDPPLAPASLLALLRVLADAEPRSIAELATAVDSREDSLRAALPVLADHGVRRLRDGRLCLCAGADLLERARVEDQLAAITRARYHLDVRGVTGSTNDDARALLDGARTDGAAPVVLAEAQASGRGRRGRPWQSPVASNVYLTQVEALPGGPESARGLSLVVGVAVAEALERLHDLDVSLKWPNDLLVRRRKLGGILVELAMAGGRLHALIGIGINVRIPAYVARRIDQPWTDLASEAGSAASRNEIAAAVIGSVGAAVEAFRGSGFDARTRARWQARDPFFGLPVMITSADDVMEGIARGIDRDGELLVDTPTGRRSIGAGEVSIRLLEAAS
jgi:BirA family biotin operon repressor/biotin-[acetyl-CoA-carboxylase] ligase